MLDWYFYGFVTNWALPFNENTSVQFVTRPDRFYGLQAHSIYIENMLILGELLPIHTAQPPAQSPNKAVE